MKRFVFAMLALPLAMLVACGGDDDNNDGAVAAVLLNDAIAGYVQTHYPGAVINSIEMEPGGLVDVDILHDATTKDVYFTTNGSWVLTKWDVNVSTLPALITDAVSSAYPDYVIDDADFVQSPSGNYYGINIERGNFEKNLKVALDGSSVEEI